MADLATALINLALDWMTVTGTPTRPAGFYLALFTTNPTAFTAAAGAVEATGGSYVRKQLVMDAADARATANTAEILWTLGTDIAAGTYTGWGVYTADSGGTYLGGCAFSANRTIAVSGDKIRFPAGEIDLTIPAA